MTTNQLIFDDITPEEVVKTICKRFLESKTGYFLFNINGKNFAIIQDDRKYIFKRYREDEFKLWMKYGHKHHLIGDYDTNYAICNFTKSFCREDINRFRRFMFRDLFGHGRLTQVSNEVPHNDNSLVFKNIKDFGQKGDVYNNVFNKEKRSITS